MITTQTQQVNYNRANFLIPAFSKLLNVFLQDNCFTILYEYNVEETETKSIILEYQQGYLYNYEPSYNSKYWGTVLKQNTIVNSSSNNSGITSNISINLDTFPEYFHIFVEEILPICESRDRIIDEII